MMIKPARIRVTDATNGSTAEPGSEKVMMTLRVCLLMYLTELEPVITKNKKVRNKHNRLVLLVAGYNVPSLIKLFRN